MNLRWRIQWRPPESNVFAALYYVIYHLTHFEFTDFGVYYWLLIFIFVPKSFWSYRGRKNQGPGLRGSKFFSLQDLRRCMSSRLSNVWDRLKQEQQSFSDKSRAVSALNSFKKVLEVFHLKRIAKLFIFFLFKTCWLKKLNESRAKYQGHPTTISS